MLTFMSRTSIFKALKFISDNKILTYYLNIVYSRWPPFELKILRIFVIIQKKSLNDFLIKQIIVTCLSHYLFWRYIYCQLLFKLCSITTKMVVINGK